jgi:putative addiction module component (TIGR02574 family)
MTTTLESLGINRMNLEERLALVQAIWDSIAESTERSPLSDELRAELDRRLADHEANPGDTIPWEQVKAEALARFKK